MSRISLLPSSIRDILLEGDVRLYINVGTPASPALFVVPYTDPKTRAYIQVTPLDDLIELTSNANVRTQVTRAGVPANQYRYVLIEGTEAAK